MTSWSLISFFLVNELVKNKILKDTLQLRPQLNESKRKLYLSETICDLLKTVVKDDHSEYAFYKL